MLMQADEFFKFNEDDLIIICWTSITREDRFIGDVWQTHGNIYTQDFYSNEFIKKYVDPLHCQLRDFASMKAAYEFLTAKKCQFHQLKMMEFESLDQYRPTDHKTTLVNAYTSYMNRIASSFYEVLWNGDLENKRRTLREEISSAYNDYHPHITEHLIYLERVFGPIVSPSTKKLVTDTHNQTISLIRKDKNHCEGLNTIRTYLPEVDIAGHLSQELMFLGGL
jgi:hypothetical protein